MFEKIIVPRDGEQIAGTTDALQVPDHPIIPCIEGDGIGSDISRAMHIVLDAAVQKAYSGKKRIVWMEIFAGEQANERYGSYLPEETLKAIQE